MVRIIPSLELSFSTISTEQIEVCLLYDMPQTDFRVNLVSARMKIGRNNFIFKKWLTFARRSLGINSIKIKVRVEEITGRFEDARRAIEDRDHQNDNQRSL